MLVLLVLCELEPLLPAVGWKQGDGTAGRERCVGRREGEHFSRPSISSSSQAPLPIPPIPLPISLLQGPSGGKVVSLGQNSKWKQQVVTRDVWPKIDLEHRNKETENNWLQLHLDHMVAASVPLGTALILTYPQAQFSILPSMLGAPFRGIN